MRNGSSTPLHPTKRPIGCRLIYTWAPGKVSGLNAVEQCLKKLWEDGYTPDQVAVISYHGVESSEALAQEKLGGYKTKRFGGYDEAGNALWTDGALLVDSVYRYKGQSMPVVVFCEIDFEELTEKDKRKLFVGLTLGQVRVDIVMSEKAPICCCNPLGLSYSRQPMFLG